MTGVPNYPPPTGRYRVRINRNADWRAVDRARLQISLGNSRYEGDKLFAILEWCAHRFAETTLIVSDTLRRHNYDAPPDVALALSRQDGDRWLDRNRDVLRRFPCRQTRWDEWLAHPRYPEARCRVTVGRSAYIQEGVGGVLVPAGNTGAGHLRRNYAAGTGPARDKALAGDRPAEEQGVPDMEFLI